MQERRAETLGRLFGDWAMMDARDVVERLDRATEHMTGCPVLRLRQLRCTMECVADCGIDSIAWNELETAVTKAKSTLELISLTREQRGEQLQLEQEG